MWGACSAQPLAKLLEKANVKYYRDSIRLYCPNCKASTNFVLNHDRQVYVCDGRTDWHGGKLMRLAGCGLEKKIDDASTQRSTDRNPA